MVARELSPFAKSIIEYQEKNHLTLLSFRCIMFLSYRVTFLCNVLGQILPR